MRTLFLSSLLTLLLAGPVLAQDSQPAAKASLSEVFAKAREAGALKDGKVHTYFRGQNPSVALVEHQATLAKGALTSVFTEHGSGGAFVRSTYQLDSKGVLQKLTIERGTRESYPDATESRSYAREKGELVEQVKEGQDAIRAPLPEDAIPMAIVTFFLPRIAGHLPSELEFTPLFEAQVHPQTMTLRASGTKAGAEVAILVGGQAALTIHVDPDDRIERLEAPGNVIKKLSKADAEAALAKLRPA